MRSKLALTILGIAFLLTGIARAQEPLKSTLDDQTKVEVTAYNNNLGLVKDIRKINLPQGEGELRFMDVASLIMPQTVHISSLTKPGELSILEQNYEYDLMDQNKLMDKYVGQTVKLIERHEYQGTQKEIEATLLSNNNGPIYQIGGEIYLGYPGSVVLPKIPENLIAKPTLTWQFQNKSSSAQNVEVSYLTNGINWLADYILVVDKADALGSLSGWVTVNNNSGATYKDAKLKLVAGKVNQVQPASTPAFAAVSGLMREREDESKAFAEQAFFEYHIYDLQRPTTIKEKQTKQISLLSADNVTLKKVLLARGEASYFRGQYTHGEPMKMPVQVYINFKNAEANHLGMPLPAGTVRLYKQDPSESLQFIGEDAIEHTPKDEELKLKIGEAFDIVAERKQTDYKVLNNVTYETAWEVTFRNHKKEAVTVNLIEPLTEDWRVLESSQPFTKVDAFTVGFDVPIPADGTTTVTYRVRVRY